MNNARKYLYLLALSSVLATGCSQSNDIEPTYIESEASDSEDLDIVEETEETVTTEDNNSLEEDSSSGENFASEEELVNYFKKLKDDVEVLLTVNDREFIEKIDERVMIFVNFMTDDTTVGGYTYSDLTEDSKIAIKTLYFEMDQMIEEAKPDYKEILKEKSVKFKDFCVNKYNTIKDQIMTWYEEGTLKDNLYNETIGKIDDDVKELYDKAKEKVKKR